MMAVYRMLTNVLCIFIAANLTSGEKNEATQQATDIHVNVPNFFRALPNIEKFVTDSLKDSSKTNAEKLPAAENPVSVSLAQTRENYERLRKVLDSVFGGQSEVFKLNLKTFGQKTKLDLSTPLGDVSVKSKFPDSVEKDQSQTSSDVEDTTTESEESTTEVPFHVYLKGVLAQQGRTLHDLDKIAYEGQKRLKASEYLVPESKTKPEANIRHPTLIESEKINQRRRVMRANIESYSLSDPSRYGDTGGELEDELDQSEPDNFDPQEEYMRQMEQQTRRYFQIEDVTTTEIPINYGERDQKTGYGPSMHQDQIPRDNVVNDVYLYPDVREPIKRMTNYYYVLDQNQRTAEVPDSEPETFDEYIDDIEGVTGHLSEESKHKLRLAFEQFKSSLDAVQFGEKVDLNQLVESQQESHNYWFPRRIIDQRDLEIAFSNIDKETAFKPNPGDRVVIAFTLTGVPLKIIVDGEIKNPLGYLHQILSEAGVTLNVPVNSYEDQTPIGGEVLFVGAGNRGKDVTQAVSLLIPRVDDLKKHVSRFLKERRYNPDFGRETSSQTLSESLNVSLASKRRLNFSDSLIQNFRRNPVQVLVDIISFLNKSQNSEHESQQNINSETDPNYN